MPLRNYSPPVECAADEEGLIASTYKRFVFVRIIPDRFPPALRSSSAEKRNKIYDDDDDDAPVHTGRVDRHRQEVNLGRVELPLTVADIAS